MNENAISELFERRSSALHHSTWLDDWEHYNKCIKDEEVVCADEKHSLSAMGSRITDTGNDAAHDFPSSEKLRTPSPARCKKSTLDTAFTALEGKQTVGISAQRLKKDSLWNKLCAQYRKNYCPRRRPPLVLPTPPTEEEKYTYVEMNKWFMIILGALALSAFVAGSWLLASSSPAFSWLAIYAFVFQLWMFSTLFITIFGRNFDVSAHERVVDKLKPIEPPKVDIYLPVCNEPLEILANAWSYTQALRTPNVTFHVLDDGGDLAVRSLAERFGFNYILRPDRPYLKKAGNIRHAFTQTSGDLFAIFDADFCPRSDFLHETVPYFSAYDDLAILQTPHFFRSTTQQTWTERGGGAVHECTERIIQTCRDRWGAAFCEGSNAVYRRKALSEINGCAAKAHSEDVNTGLYALTHGWKVKIIALNLACGVGPDLPDAFFSQQVRWCTGSLQLLFSREFWKCNITAKQKACYFMGFVYYLALALPMLFSYIPAPLIVWTKPDIFKYYNSFLAFPIILVAIAMQAVWSRSKSTMPVQYVQVIMAAAYLQSVWDMMVGSSLRWTPSRSDVKKHARREYRRMRVFLAAWLILQQTVLISGCVYRVMGGMGWYNIVPTLVIDAWFVLCMHRFLFFGHPKT